MKPSSSSDPDTVSAAAQVSAILRNALWDHERPDWDNKWTDEEQVTVGLRPFSAWPERLKAKYAKTDAVEITEPGPVRPWMRELPAAVRAKFPELAD